MAAMLWMAWLIAPLASLSASALVQAEETYPRAEMLVEVEELIRATPDARASSYLILDARPRKKYEENHIPGALWVDTEQWSKAFATEATALARGLQGHLKKAADRRIVIYDDSRTNQAARVWWILRYAGARKVSLLNGGWLAWTARKAPVESGFTDVQKWPDPMQHMDEGDTTFAEANTKRLITMRQLLEVLKEPGQTQIVDARSEGEYCGMVGMAKRLGSIPGAIHLEWTDLLDAKTHRFKAPAELRELFAKAGIKLDQPAVTYCQSGGRASVMAFALELMGGRQVQNYYASWAEWGNQDETPIVKPKPKKPASDQVDRR